MQWFLWDDRQRTPYFVVKIQLTRKTIFLKLNFVLSRSVSKIKGVLIHSQKGVQMMKNGKSVIAVLAMIALIVVLSGCPQEGPLERAGKKVDKAIEDIKK
jgi:hypothetical protein